MAASEIDTKVENRFFHQSTPLRRDYIVTGGSRTRMIRRRY